MISSKPRSGGLAQLARAPALQAGGPGFESPCLHQNINAISNDPSSIRVGLQGAIAQLVRARH